MTDVRVTQVGVEALEDADPDVRVTQVGAEATLSADLVDVRVTQVGVEVALTADVAVARITQVGVEALLDISLQPVCAGPLIVSGGVIFRGEISISIICE